jgi:hypothetical protein
MPTSTSVAPPAAPSPFLPATGAEELNELDADAIFAAAEAEAQEGMGSAERRSGKRRSPTLLDERRASVAPSSTPNKGQVPRWTPSKLARADGADSVSRLGAESVSRISGLDSVPRPASTRKVHFRVGGAAADDDAAAEAEEATDSFSLFSLPTDKENGANAAAAGAPKRPAAMASARTEAAEQPPPSRRLGGAGLLGGAARVVVHSKPKARGAAGKIAKARHDGKGGGGGGGLRRMSLATQQAVESAASLKPKRPAWE